jgi:hypothetical protein
MNATIYKDYQEMQKAHEALIKDFKFKFFAFDDEQFQAGKEKLKVNTSAELLSIGYGGYIRKDKKEDYSNIFKKMAVDTEENFKNEVFLYNAFLYELNNHEYYLTQNDACILSALGLKRLSIKDAEIFENAKEVYLEQIYKNNLNDL